ncbi:hypothetical protein FCK90_04555 [Kocuria coralli]|uniref:Uncharacterized protein n=1 Tax=Kocuria coralli TaxID=1461025 RepID=A0A5J5L1H9_9MICC|nr:hypothetical protein [Kocuria coralli]KAA9394811.1 hypothetical protein FCK90_04555 [Kocuria coralli]
MSPSRINSRSSDRGGNADESPRRRRRAEHRLLPVALGLWALSLVSFVLAFVLGNTGSGAAMSISFIGGLLLATLADVGAFLTALASSITYRRHRPWNVLVLLGTVLVSPATLLLLLQALLTL